MAACYRRNIMWPHLGNTRYEIQVQQIEDHFGTLFVRLNEMTKRMEQLNQKLEKIMAAIDDLAAAVAAEDTEIASAIILLNGIPKLITDAVNAALAAGATPAMLAQITALATDVQANMAKLAAAVVANTPAAPPPAPAA